MYDFSEIGMQVELRFKTVDSPMLSLKISSTGSFGVAGSLRHSRNLRYESFLTRIEVTRSAMVAMIVACMNYMYH